MVDSAVECVICGNHATDVVLEVREPDRFERSVGVSSIGYSRKLLDCNSCGLVTNVLPSQSQELLADIRESYYEVDFADDSIAEKYSRIMGLKHANSDNRQRVDRIIHFFGGSASNLGTMSVVSVGEGLGVFLSALREIVGTSWHLDAIESDPLVASHLRDLGLFGVIQGSFPGTLETSEPESQGCLESGYNLVTLNKVLEHLEEPVAFLGTVSRLMASEKSILYIEVPDKASIEALPTNDNAMGPLHCHLYSMASLLMCIEKSGLSCVEIGRITEPSGKRSLYAFCRRGRDANASGPS